MNNQEMILQKLEQFYRQLNAVNKTAMEINQLITKELLAHSKPRLSNYHE